MTGDLLLRYTVPMIGEIRGTIVHTAERHVTVLVHGIGYLVHTTVPTSRLPLEHEVHFYTHLAVRETALDLYGFLDRDTLAVFELLLTLPKIGPKSAQQILSQADTALLKEAARNNDPTYLTKMSGIGKKSAEKIVTGLKEKLDLEDETSTATTDVEKLHANSAYIRDTIDALVALGYPYADARNVTHQVARDYPEINDSATALRTALKMF